MHFTEVAVRFISIIERMSRYKWNCFFYWSCVLFVLSSVSHGFKLSYTSRALSSFRCHLGKNSQFDGFYNKFSSQLSSLSINGIMDLICLLDPPPNSYLFPKTDISPENIPTINRFLIANPQTFFLNEDIAKAYGASFERLFLLFQKYQHVHSKFKYYLEHPQEIIHDLSLLAYILPVIYIAEYNRGSNVVGFQINSPSCKLGPRDTKDTRLHSSVETMKDLFPYLKAIRSQEIYQGGFEKKGTPFLMLNQLSQFPGNRKFRSLPGREEFEVYYSRDYAMANDLLLTNDAKATDFKFFQYSTNWSPQDLDRQCADQLWFVVDAPSQLIFAREQEIEYPLYSRIVNSILHPDFESVLLTADSPEIQKKRRMLFQGQVGGPVIGAAGGLSSSASSRGLGSGSPSSRRANRGWEDTEHEDDADEPEIDLNKWKQSRENRKESVSSLSSTSTYNPFNDSPRTKIPTTPPSSRVSSSIDSTDLDRQLSEMTNRFRMNDDQDEAVFEDSEDFDEGYFARMGDGGILKDPKRHSQRSNSKKKEVDTDSAREADDDGQDSEYLEDFFKL